MGVKYYRRHDKEFKWKHPAQEFVKKLKAKAKKAKLKVVVEILPHTQFISTTEWSESRVTGYTVRWYYKP